MTQQQDEAAKLLGSEWQGSPALFLGEFGQPLYPNSLAKWFSAFQETHGLRKVGLHALRHTHASMLISMNKDKVQVSRRLGHSQLSTTLNTYTHLFEEIDTLTEDLSEEFGLKNKIFANFSPNDIGKEKNH